MALKCLKCFYKISEYEVIGHFVGDLYETWKKYLNKGVLDDGAHGIILGLANNLQIPCPVCKKWKSWLSHKKNIGHNKISENQDEL